MRGNQRLVWLLFFTFRVLRNPSREFWIATTLKLLKNPLQTLGRIFAKPKDPVTKNNKPTLFILFPCNDYDHDYIGQTKRQFGTLLKEHQKAVFFCKNENSALSEHTCLTNHTIGWDKSKIITTNRRYHQRLCLEAWRINSAHVMIAAYFLTPSYTSSQKSAAIGELIKGPLFAAFRSPLMKVLDRSVETLGLWTVISQSHSLNLSTRVASNHVWWSTWLNGNFKISYLREKFAK